MNLPGCWKRSRRGSGGIRCRGTRRSGSRPRPSLGALWRGLPAQAASVRHLALAGDAADNDVVDPYRRGEDVYLQMEDELAPALLTILRFAREHG